MQAKAVGTLILIVAVFASGWLVRGWKEGSDREAAIREERDHLMQSIALFQDKAQEAERVIKEYKDKQPTVTQIVKTIERPIYRADCIDDDGLHMVEKAAGLSGQSADKEPDDTTNPKGQDGR